HRAAQLQPRGRGRTARGDRPDGAHRGVGAPSPLVPPDGGDPPLARDRGGRAVLDRYARDRRVSGTPTATRRDPDPGGRGSTGTRDAARRAPSALPSSFRGGSGSMGRSRGSRPRFSVLAALCALLAGGPAGARGQEPAVLRGIVAEEGSGREIPSARVVLVGAEAETRSEQDGSFAFPDAPLGRHFLRVQADGFPTVVQEVELAPGDELFLPIFVTP